MKLKKLLLPGLLVVTGICLFLAGFGASQAFSLIDLQAQAGEGAEDPNQIEPPLVETMNSPDVLFTVETLADELFKSQTFPMLTITQREEPVEACFSADHQEGQEVHDDIGCITDDSGKTIVKVGAQPVEEIVYERNRVNMMAYPELFGNPVTLTHAKLKNILPDEPEPKLYELAVRLELMDSEDAVSLLVALSRNYQTGDDEKTAFYDAVTGVSSSLSSLAFAMETTVAGYCKERLEATDMLLLITDKRVSRTFARLYQKRRVNELEGWIMRYNICERI
ncbi:hypothetical protein BCT46_07200 [Vibrio sp. 10N.261.46.E8]|nr:hypothetical protein BH584_03730 [Vibrio sp. 10N.261.45.E1]PMJ22067.1 hypothetical protein BCU27_16770 [Vibrio sp. 10N.286.45.B6]PML86320.1 hypothetical protein BCT66_14585 [Vibrio sp. 10N.261.49.E11]PMM76621.1 hypothetical protein BCT48_02285 [Vibrio sp. 10N.261.46.F12]PMM86945.1 hypothetical protein BCT46_07200 [Vibrio sp. 10N.261.46.E8]PMN77284.1 hypothetical protein BCT22_21200 [Vibrio sp. 10N.261.45.A1]PMN79487.1 hypothetical protein BCT25_16090 [Vibrio sp. 10N.261.45.A6]